MRFICEARNPWDLNSSSLYVLGEQVVPLAQLYEQPLVATLLSNGQPLRAGDVLLTGTQAPIADVAQGNRLCFQVTGLGEVTCSFG